MSERMRDIQERKRAMRNRLADLTYDEKVVLLERLRDRSLAIAGSPLRRRKAPYDVGQRILRER